jgi:predicted Zn finger-like uncharacterized protein
MNQPPDRVTIPCPGCSPEFDTVHEVLSPGGTATVRCGECGHTHKVDLTPEPTVDLDAVVSQSGESFAARTEAPAEETLAVGEEFVLETDEAILVVRITDLELSGDRRTDAAPAEEVSTVWTRAVGNVELDVTVHPADGAREETESLALQVPGDDEYVVGETIDLGEKEATIEGLYLRSDASGYDYDKLDYDGDAAPAKDIERVYARATKAPWSAW